MERYDAKQIGEFIAYGTAVSYAFFKIAQNIFKVIKDVFEKKTNKSEKGITVNVNANNQQTEAHTVSPVDAALFHVLLEQSQLLYIMYNMRSDILKEQMSYFTKMIKFVKVSLTNIVVDILKEAGLAANDYCTYFSNFENFMDLVDTRISMTFRTMCKNNHFSEYSTGDYSNLVKTNISLIEGEIDELFRTRYPQRLFISNFDRIRATRQSTRAILIDCFDEARRITINKEEIVRKTKEEFEDKISKVTKQTYKFKEFN